jgi:uncharacterized protein Yka (UPF0111/DUF47 family)
MRFRLVPTDDAFFGLFNDSAANVAECAHTLRDLVSEPTDPSAHEKIAACEHRGRRAGACHREAAQHHVRHPVRPRGHPLAEELDGVVDDMLEVSHRMQITGITSARPELKEQADLLVQCAEETRALLERLESMKGVRPISTPSTASRARATLSTVASSPACSAASSTPWRCCGGRTSSSRWSGR